MSAQRRPIPAMRGICSRCLARTRAAAAALFLTLVCVNATPNATAAEVGGAAATVDANGTPSAATTGHTAPLDDEEEEPASNEPVNLNPFGIPDGLPLNYAAPATGPRRACSFYVRLCVSGQGAAAVLTTLARAERVAATLAGQLGADVFDHGTRLHELEIILTPSAAPGPMPPPEERPRLRSRDVRSGLDKAEYFVQLEEAAVASGQGELLLARQMAKLAVLHFAPATDNATLLALSNAMVFDLLADARSASEFDALYMFTHPELTPWRVPALDTLPFDSGVLHEAVTRARATIWGGAALFFDWLDASYGREPGRLLIALAALGPSKTALTEQHWSAEPDVLDVLRITSKDVRFHQSKFEDLWLDYAIDLAKLSKHELPHHPGMNGLQLAWASLAPSQLAWDIPFPTTPRRLLGPAPVQPLGSVYYRINLATKPPNTGVRAEFEWEGYSRMRWCFLAFDSEGKLTKRKPVPVAEKAVFAGDTLVEFGAATELWLVGTALGDPRSPFDPDDLAFEPHGYMVTIGASQ
jgi:hypothetical protein